MLELIMNWSLDFCKTFLRSPLTFLPSHNLSPYPSPTLLSYFDSLDGVNVLSNLASAGINLCLVCFSSRPVIGQLKINLSSHWFMLPTRSVLNLCEIAGITLKAWRLLAEQILRSFIDTFCLKISLFHQ